MSALLFISVGKADQSLGINKKGTYYFESNRHRTTRIVVQKNEVINRNVLILSKKKREDLSVIFHSFFLISHMTDIFLI